MIGKQSRFWIIVGAVLLQIPIGAIYSWTLFNEALHEKFMWDIGDIIFTYSLTIFVFALTTIFSGRLLDKYGAKLIATIGALLYGSGVLLTSSADTLFELYLFYGIIGGIGVGFVYVCPLATCIKWFPQKKGLVTGIVIGAFGIGSLVFKSIIQALLITRGVSETFFWLGIIYLVLTITGAQLLREPKKTTCKTTLKKLENSNFTVRQMVKTKNFYFIWISYLFACIGGLLVIGSAMEIGLQMAGASFEQAAQAVAIMAIFNATGRLFWGAISDHIGTKPSTTIMFILTAIAMFLLSYLELNIPLFYILIALTTFCFGGFLVIYPAITTEYFGVQNIGKNYGVIYQAYGIAALCGPLLLKNSYTFIISGILAIIGAIFIIQINKSKACS